MLDVTDLKVHFLSFIDFENLSSVRGSFFSRQFWGSAWLLDPHIEYLGVVIPVK